MPLRVDIRVEPLSPRETIDTRCDSMWRYRKVLPVAVEDAVTLGEGWTPLVEAGEGVWVKDEAPNPTGSFKARGMAMAVSAARSLGAARLVAPSAGNAAVALSAYGEEAGVAVTVAMPLDTPQGIAERCRDHGARVELVEGTIADAGRWLAANRRPGDFDVSTLKEPYRVEGKKTMGYELFEQMGPEQADVVIYPTGGGTGLVGMWKAWGEMRRMGWAESAPRMVSVQAEGCAPVVAAFAGGEEVTRRWENPVTSAYGLRVPDPIGGFLCLRAIRDTGGTALAIDEAEIHAATERLGEQAGVDACPEGGAAWAAYERLVSEGWITAGERVVVFNTGAGANYR